jgi:hypothetical protein
VLYGLTVLLSSPPNTTLLRRHLAVLLVADLAHWAVLLLGTVAEHRARQMTLAPGGGAGLAERFLLGVDAAAWDANTWGLMVGPLATFVVKLATLMGRFGRIGAR